METIRSNDEISALFSLGKRYSNRYISFIFSNTPSLQEQSPQEHDHHGRVAFITGKRLGNAVWRNTAKRRMREIYRALDGPWKEYDLLFIARSSLLDASYSKVLTTCDKTLNGIHQDVEGKMK